MKYLVILFLLSGCAQKPTKTREQLFIECIKLAETWGFNWDSTQSNTTYERWMSIGHKLGCMDAQNLNHGFYDGGL